MNAKITFNKSANGSTTGRVIIPKAILEALELDQNNRDVDIRLKDGEIVIVPLKKKDE